MLILIDRTMIILFNNNRFRMMVVISLDLINLVYIKTINFSPNHLLEELSKPLDPWISLKQARFIIATNKNKKKTLKLLKNMSMTKVEM